MSSGVPQGSVLGVIAFLIYIADISHDIDPAVLLVILSMFADDNKLARAIRSQLDADTLQSALDLLSQWSNNWGMPFNAKKCVVMHLGHKNPLYSYQINGHTLESTPIQRDLGVQIHESLKPFHHITKQVNRANSILGQLKKTMSFKSKDVLVMLFKTIVRPHLEYASTVWRPWLKKDIELLEKVQRRFVKMVWNLDGLTYEEKLQDLGLTSIQSRHETADMVQTYKLIQGIDHINLPLFTQTSQVHSHETRQAARQGLVRGHTDLNLRKNFFTQRIKHPWSALSVATKNSPTTNSFKANYIREIATQNPT